MKNNYTLITGSTSDIGIAISKELHKNNNLLLHGRNLSKLEKLKNILKGENKIEIWIQDFNEIDVIKANLNKILIKKNINISSFVHCAAAVKILSIKNFKISYYNEIFNINFFSAVEIIKSLTKRKNMNYIKTIIFISSIYSNLGSKGNSMYASSKGALDTLTKTLATELKPIRVNSILPGAIKTQMSSHIFSDDNFKQKFDENYLLGEGSVEDISNMVSFLASEKSKWITGQNIIIDGGYSSH